MYEIYYTKKSVQDIPKLKSVKLEKKAKALIDVLRENNYQNPPPYKKLQGDLSVVSTHLTLLTKRIV